MARLGIKVHYHVLILCFLGPVVFLRQQDTFKPPGRNI